MSFIKVYITNNDGLYTHSRVGGIDTVMSAIDSFKESFTLTPPPDYENQWRWIEDKWVADEPQLQPIVEIQAQVWEGIKSMRLEQVTSGVLVKSISKKFHTDETSAIQYSNVAGMIALNNYEPIEWKVMDNTWVLLTKELFIELQKAMNANTQATYAIAEQHKEAMMLLDDPSNYDFSTGWTNGVIDYN